MQHDCRWAKSRRLGSSLYFLFSTYQKLQQRILVYEGSTLSLVETYRGSVNTWECDENNHQNVRFYLAKLQQGLILGVTKLGLTRPASAAALLKSVTSHHIRFLREAQVAVPQVIECGVLAYEPGQSLKLLSLMRHASTNELSATFITDLRFDARAAALLNTNPVISEVELPTEAQPRGVNGRPSSYSGLSVQQAYAAGFSTVGAGVISAAECGLDGDIETFQVMGRMSDGMPNLWALFQSATEQQARSEGITGGAVLEYRLTFHHTLTAGTQFTHLAGIHDMGNKTQNICHLIYDAANGGLVVSAEALSIAMDLNSRKSIAIPAARRERINRLLLQRLN